MKRNKDPWPFSWFQHISDRLDTEEMNRIPGTLPGPIATRIMEVKILCFVAFAAWCLYFHD